MYSKLKLFFSVFFLTLILVSLTCAEVALTNTAGEGLDCEDGEQISGYFCESKTGEPSFCTIECSNDDTSDDDGYSSDDDTSDLDFTDLEKIESSETKDIYKIANKNGGYSYLVCPIKDETESPDPSCPAGMDSDVCDTMHDADENVDELDFTDCYVINSHKKVIIVLGGKDIDGSIIGGGKIKLDIDFAELKSEIQEILERYKEDLAGILGDEGLQSLNGANPYGSGAVGKQQGNQGKESSFDIGQLMQMLMLMRMFQGQGNPLGGSGSNFSGGAPGVSCPGCPPSAQHAAFNPGQSTPSFSGGNGDGKGSGKNLKEDGVKDKKAQDWLQNIRKYNDVKKLEEKLAGLNYADNPSEYTEVSEELAKAKADYEKDRKELKDRWYKDKEEEFKKDEEKYKKGSETRDTPESEGSSSDPFPNAKDPSNPFDDYEEGDSTQLSNNIPSRSLDFPQIGHGYTPTRGADGNLEVQVGGPESTYYPGLYPMIGHGTFIDGIPDNGDISVQVGGR